FSVKLIQNTKIPTAAICIPKRLDIRRARDKIASPPAGQYGYMHTRWKRAANPLQTTHREISGDNEAALTAFPKTFSKRKSITFGGQQRRSKRTRELHYLGPSKYSSK